MVDSMAICCITFYIEKCEDSEIKSFNLITLEVVKTLTMGFAQVATVKDVRDYLTRGKELCSKTYLVRS